MPKMAACSMWATIAVVLASAPARGEGPAFDCAKADGTVEEMICPDENLAALERS